jgi:hypothetical protein
MKFIKSFEHFVRQHDTTEYFEKIRQLKTKEIILLYEKLKKKENG